MKSIKIVFVIMFVLSFAFTASFAQSGGISPKNQKEEPIKPKESKGGKYQNFELTSENIGWAKEEVKKERDKAEVEFDEGKITDEEYKSRMNKIVQAEKKIKEFESNSAMTNFTEHDDGKEAGNVPEEIVSKSDAEKSKAEAQLERDRKKREENKSKADIKSREVAPDNIKRTREQLEVEKKAGKITTAEYNERMKRLSESEKRLNEQKSTNKGSEKGSSKETKSGNYIKDPTKPANKESLSKRATDSEKYKKEQSKELHLTVSENEKKIADAKVRVAKEKQNLDRDIKSGKITQQQYDQKMVKVKKVEAAIRNLEKNVDKGKKL